MNLKNLFLLCIVLTFFNAIIYAQQSTKKFKIVIDAGHGGDDPGCIGKRMQEKTVNLNVALKLGKLISDNYDDVQVIYTRKTDATVELYKRAVIANNNHADLFISIHCNAAENHQAHGVETWVMGLAKSEANMAVARKENAAILKEKNYENNYEGFNPNSPEAYVIFSLHTSAYMNHSIMLADKVQRNLVSNTKFSDRKVQQAGFWVLYKVAMPSILVELGFLSNVVEEDFMVKPVSQDIMAISIYNAFVDYRNALDGTSKKGLPMPTGQSVPSSTPLPVSTVDSQKQTTAPSMPSTEAVSSSTASATSNASTTTSSSSNSPLASTTVFTSTGDSTKTTSQPSSATTHSNSIRFRVQFSALPENISTNDKRFAGLSDVMKTFDGKLWKYTSGNFTTLAEAKEHLKTIKSKYPDAFVVAFDGDTKITIQEALERGK